VDSPLGTDEVSYSSVILLGIRRVVVDLKRLPERFALLYFFEECLRLI